MSPSAGTASSIDSRYWAELIIFWSRIRASTTLRRSRAVFGSSIGS